MSTRGDMGAVLIRFAIAAGDDDELVRLAALDALRRLVWQAEAVAVAEAR